MLQDLMNLFSSAFRFCIYFLSFSKLPHIFLFYFLLKMNKTKMQIFSPIIAKIWDKGIKSVCLAILTREGKHKSSIKRPHFRKEQKHILQTDRIKRSWGMGDLLKQGLNQLERVFHIHLLYRELRTMPHGPQQG